MRAAESGCLEWHTCAAGTQAVFAVAKVNKPLIVRSGTKETRQNMALPHDGG